MEPDIEAQYTFMQRLLRGQRPPVSAIPTWKAALWETNSVDPAMLRAPLLIISFLFLWGCNILLLEKGRVQYFKALNISKGIVLDVYIYAYIN